MSRDAQSRAIIERLADCTPEERARILKGLKAPERRELRERWPQWAHTGQTAPSGEWRVWLVRGGRGFGKTRAGSEWVGEMARLHPGVRIALVAATLSEARRVMVEGESGLLNVAHDDERPAFFSSTGELRFPNGTRAQLFSADVPDSLRGVEHHYAWCDELAKWRRGPDAWANLSLGLRLGEQPRVLITTTPRATPLMRRIIATDGVKEATGKTTDNPHLPASFVAAMKAEYGSTRFGRQELDGEMIDDVAGALWTRSGLEGCRVATAPASVRVVVGVDPPATATGDACGIVACGVDASGVAHVLEDASVGGLSPEGWARAVAACAARWGADRVIAERNNGGDMVASVLRAADAGLPVRSVHASRGKVARAEPVAALYDAGKVRHVGMFAALEDELCGLVAGGGYEGPGRSPDRADACVWALTELMLRNRGRPGVRRV